MSDELIVDPAALSKFAWDITAQIGTLSQVVDGLTTAQSQDALFGDFEGATQINQRSSELVGEMVQRLSAVRNSLLHLQKAAHDASESYHAADHLSASSIASINAALDAFDSSTSAPVGGAL